MFTNSVIDDFRHPKRTESSDKLKKKKKSNTTFNVGTYLQLDYYYLVTVKYESDERERSFINKLIQNYSWLIL